MAVDENPAQTGCRRPKSEANGFLLGPLTWVLKQNKDVDDDGLFTKEEEAITWRVVMGGVLSVVGAYLIVIGK